MTTEFTTSPIHEDDDQPATKGDLRQEGHRLDKRTAALGSHMDQRFQLVDQRFTQVDQRLERLDQRFQEVMDHFDAVAENIHQDVSGANADEIDLIKNRQIDHEDRIAVLEKSWGSTGR